MQKYTDSLPSNKQFEVAIKLIKLALPIWDKYADKNELKYRDSVIGLTHSVDRTLLSQTTDYIETCLQTNQSDIYRFTLRGQFEDSIVALQDLDWELPYEIETLFYSVFNLLETFCGMKMTGFNESTIYVSINQAADVLETTQTLTFDEINKILYDIKNGR